MENSIRQALILGALFHDIGKFWQRCEPQGGIDKARLLNTEVKNNLSSDICPHRNLNNQTNLTHQHVAWTYQFLADNESRIFQTGTSADSSVLQLAANHHRSIPSTTLQTIIQVADCISAGQDRTGDVKDIQTELDRKYNYRKQRQRPVFESIFKADYQSHPQFSTQLKRYHLVPLQLDQSIFPDNFKDEEQELNNEYSQLWNQFYEEFKTLPQSDFQVYLESLICLLQKYIWCVPSSTDDSPDISLYDHLRSTAAIAACLYDYLEQKDASLIEPNNQSEQAKIKSFINSAEPFALLIAADISGIQKFIYQISSVKAATSLKGRSFYLQLICDAAARYFLYKLDLPLTNLIYSSGGNFYLLAPNTSQVKQAIAEISREINSKLLEHYQGALFLGVGKAELSGIDFLADLSQKWAEALNSASQSKGQRFAEAIKANHSFFAPVVKKDAKPCDNCGADCPESELKPIKGGEEEKYCPLCRQFIRTGDRLKTASLILEFISADTNLKKQPHFVYPIPDIPVGYIIVDEPNLDANVGLVHNADFKKIILLNETDYLKPLPGARYQAFARGFRFYGGNYLPRNDKDEPATFDYLAGVREDDKGAEPGFKRLGVLRMDVDNLGNIFRWGFLKQSWDSKLNQGNEVKEPYSISRIATLSSMFDLFFSGYLNTLHQQLEFKDYLYILYSGGDDLFIVGRWDKVIAFAALIRNEFKRFTCEHPDLSISGGMVLTPPKYPIHRSADLAGEAESAAKKERTVGNQPKAKDAITFLDKTLSWNDFHFAQALKDDLYRWIVAPPEGKNKMNRGLIGRLNQIYATYQKEADLIKKHAKEGQIPKSAIAERIQYNKWRWRLVYSLKRFSNQNKEYETEIQNIQKALIENNRYKQLLSEQPLIEYLDVPVKWAEYLIRTNQKEDEK